MTIRDIAISFGYDVDKNSEKKANESIDRLKSFASKALGAIAVVFSVRGMASLAEAAAEVEALNSQFTSVFGEMEKNASDSLNAIADETGVVTNRLRGSFTQIAAFAKTSGMDTAAALGVSERAMKAVTDSAAFYDKSIEEVTMSLQSFLKGNYANDAALGLSATETTRNTAANALYGKSFKDLSESQKQLTLLKMVEDANQLSGAMGQAARESDTWSNQLGNLKQKLTDLKAAVGASFLKPAVQVIKLVSQLVGILTDGIKGLTAEGTTLNRMFERMSNRIKRTQDFIDRLVQKLGGAENAVKLLGITAGAIMFALNFNKILGFIKLLGLGLGKINIKMLAITAVIVIVALLIDDLINFMQGNNSLMGEMFGKFGIDGEAVKDTIKSIMASAKELLPKILELAKSFGGYLLDVLKLILPELIEMGKTIFPIIVDIIKQLIPFIIQIARNILPVIGDLIKQLLPFVFQIIKQILPPLIGLIQKLLPFVIQIINRVLPVITELIKKLLPIVMRVIESVLPIVINLIERLLPIMMPIIDTILPLLMTLLEDLMPVITFVAELIGNSLGKAFETLAPIIDAVITIFQGLIEFITGVFTGDWSKAWDGVVNIFKGIIDGLAAIFKIPINFIIEGINTFLGGLNELKIPDWVPVVGGKGINIPLIPMLAKGSDNSPDTFIAGEEGPELITGAKGRKVFTSRKTDALFQTLKDIMTLGITPRSETVAASASSVENKTIVQNVEINNKFEGDRAGQRKSSTAMEKAADDATGIMARGLAYAR